jgi:hypothetical protein
MNGQTRLAVVRIPATMAAVLACGEPQLYANGLTPVYSSPIPEIVSVAGIYLSLVLVLCGLIVAIRRGGMRGTMTLIVACVLACITVLGRGSSGIFQAGFLRGFVG